MYYHDVSVQELPQLLPGLVVAQDPHDPRHLDDGLPGEALARPQPRHEPGQHRQLGHLRGARGQPPLG